MTKGNRCPFDSAVAVNLQQYRAETMKFDLCDSLITALNIVVRNQEGQINTFVKKLENNKKSAELYRNELLRNREYSDQLMIEFEKINALYKKEKTWIKKNGKWVAFGIGIIVGSVATYYIID